jgi:putative aminopeptidase FrvX
MFIQSTLPKAQVSRPNNSALPVANESPAKSGASGQVLSQDSVSLSRQEQNAQTVAHTKDDWGVMGQKLGALALVSAGSATIPFRAIMAFPNMPLPAAIALSIGTMAGLAIEERKIGIGKKIGKLIGSTLGTAAGHAKAQLGLHSTNSKTPIELKRVSPDQVKKFEALAPRLLHSGQKLLSGAEAQRTRSVEFGELIGATAGVMATSYLVPKLAVAIAGESSIIASVAGTLVGPLAGMIVGGWQENTLGLGRAAGELVGTGLSKLGIGDTMPVDMEVPKFLGAQSEPGALKKAFLGLNKAIAEPIIGPLVDATVASNGLFAEKPVQTMNFSERPQPTVNRERLIKNFVELASIYGPSGEEELVGQELIKRTQELGATTKMTDDGSVIATIKATPGFEDAPTVLLSAHQDTVEPTSADSIRVTEYKIHTDGSHILGADDRAGIAQILEGIQSVQEQGQAHPELKLVFPVDEERGLRGAARLHPDEISTRPTLGFVVDALDVNTLHLTNDAVILTPRSTKYTFKQSDPIAQVALRSMAQAGTNPKVRHSPILTGAGSDANTPGFNSGHIQSIAVGVGEQNMHTGMEQIKTNDLERAARHVVGYITNACDLKVEGDDIVPRFG